MKKSFLNGLYYIDDKMLRKNINKKDFINILFNEVEFFDHRYKQTNIEIKHIQTNYYYIIINYLKINKILDIFKEKNKPLFKRFTIIFKTKYNFMMNYTFFHDLNNPMMHVTNILNNYIVL